MYKYIYIYILVYIYIDSPFQVDLSLGEETIMLSNSRQIIASQASVARFTSLHPLFVGDYMVGTLNS